MSLSLNNVGEFLNLWHFFEDRFVFGDGSLGAGFKISGKDISCATDEEVSQFTRKLENLVTSLDEGMSLQFLYRLTPTVEALVNEHIDLSKDCPIPNYDIILKARKKHLKENSLEGRFFNPEIYLFLRGRPYSFKKQKLFQKEKEYLQVEESEFHLHHEDQVTDRAYRIGQKKNVKVYFSYSVDSEFKTVEDTLKI